MSKDFGKIFDDCQRAVGRAFAAEVITCTDDELRDIANCHQVLRKFIHEMAGEENPDCLRHVASALEDVNPEREHSLDTMLRDMADICVTLNRVGEGRSRSVRMKLAEATLFFPPTPR